MSYRTIFLKSAREGDPVNKEAEAAAALSPGHLIQYDTNLKVKKHATAGGWAAPMFAIEDSLFGDEIGDAYSAADRVQFIVAASGDEVAAWLATGENVSKGDPLESNGAGLLRKSSGEASELPGSIIAVAMEAVNLSSSDDVDTMLRVMVL